MMKFALLALLAATGFASDDPKSSTFKKPVPAATEKKAPAPAPRSQPLTAIPKDAVRIEPNTYRWKDPKGKEWILRETPFTIAKIDPKDYTASAPAAPAPSNVIAVEDGDSIRFERPSPFGTPVKWTKKKSELNEEEQAIWKRTQQN